MPSAFLIDRRLQVGWGTSSFAVSVWLWGQKMCLLPTGPREGSLPPQLHSAHWCVLGLLQADAELCQGSLQAALTSPKASGKAPEYVCYTHRGSRGRLLMCKSMSWVSCPSRGWPLGWMLLAVSVPQVQQHSERSCDGREHRLEDITGRGAWVFQSSFLFIRDFMFLFLLISMVCSWAIALEERTCLQSYASPSWKGSVALPALNIPWTFIQLLNWSATQAALSELCPGVWVCEQALIWRQFLIKNFFPFKTNMRMWSWR